MIGGDHYQSLVNKELGINLAFQRKACWWKKPLNGTSPEKTFSKYSKHWQTLVSWWEDGEKDPDDIAKPTSIELFILLPCWKDLVPQR